MISATTFLIAWPLFWLACAALVAWPLVRHFEIGAHLRRASGAGLMLLTCVVAYGFCDRLVFADDTASTPAATAPPESPPAVATAPEEKPLNTPIGEASQVIIPPGRPSWVEGTPSYEAGVQKIAVRSEPFARAADAERALDEKLVQKTADYIVEHLHGNPRARDLVKVDIGTIRAKLVKPENIYEEQITVSIGPMYQKHALLEFRPEFQREITQRWNAIREESRLLQLALVVGSILLFVTVAFAYVRLENSTRGAYSSRLQFMAAAAILLVVGSGAALARILTWL